VIAEPVWFAQDARMRRLLLGRLVVFCVALVVGATVLAGLLGGLGAALLPPRSMPVAIALGALAGLVILRETAGRSVPIPQLRWQVPPEWLRSPWLGAAAFGSIMGAGIFTLQRSALFHLYLVGCVCSGGSGRGALFGLVYGLTYVGALARGMFRTRAGEPGLGVDWVAHAWTRVRWVGVAAAPLIVLVPFA
jgi:hypothetical protein